jgi:hypothetical protein
VFWDERLEHYITAHRHPMVRAGIIAYAPVKFTGIYINRLISLLHRFINHPVEFHFEFICGGHVFAAWLGSASNSSAGVNDSEVPALIRKGITGIFLKHGSPASLIQGIRETVEGKALFSAGFTSKGSGTSRHSQCGRASSQIYRAREAGAFICL